MDHLPNRYVQFYQYILELFPIWIVIYFFHMQNNLGASLISFFCLAIVAYAVSTLVFLKSGKPLIALGPILAAGLAFLFGYHYVLVIVMAIVLFVRIESHLLKPDQDHEEKILISTLVMSVVAYEFINGHPYANNYLLIAAVFLFTFLLGRFLLYYFSDPDGANNVGKKKAIWFLSIALLLFVGTYSLTTLFPYIRLLFGYVFYGVLMALAWIVSPIMQLTEYINIEPPEIESIKSDPEFVTGPEQQRTETTMLGAYIEWFLYGVGGLIILLLVFLFLRYRRNLVREDATQREQTITVKRNRTTEQRFWKGNRHQAPKNPIRKMYYRLEKWATDQNVGRYRDETIDEWLDRQQIFGHERQEVIELYEKIRYAEKDDESRAKSFQDNISLLKQMLKSKKESNNE
ncbi:MULTISPECIES: MFS transporter [Allobacillus]|uniref:MFS transporter n=1 Tax=Allobacillus salarius TaxID=1955272 RepID=A0A556PP44_9BACI|nr:MFS transporter [Allobacillus salarius]TSJ66164.1 MFS transporter [Allobacillus salarius]